MISKEIKDNFARDRQIINKFYRFLPTSNKADQEEILSWMSDHLRMITGQLDDLRAFVKIKYFDVLPKNKNGSIRIYAFLEVYLAEHHYKLLPNDLKKSINQLQKETPLQIKELWFVSTAIRLIIFHELAGILEKVFAGEVKKADVTKIKNVVMSLLAYEKVDWRIFFEETSLVEKFLRKDPGGIYPFMDFTTRDSYRHAVEHLSLQSGKDEIKIVTDILEAANNSKQKSEERHIGYYLLGKSRRIIEKEIGYKYTIRERILWLSARAPGLFYFLLIFIICFVGILQLGLSLVGVGVTSWFFWLYLVFFAIPILIFSEDIVNYIYTKIVKPKSLFKMNFSQEIPIWARTMVVIPTQLGTNSDEPEKLLSQLESNYLNNQTENIFFAPLLAFRDSSEKIEVITPEELDNFQKVKKGIESLNLKYSQGQPIFFIFLRPRIWDENEQLSIEWERKRGKIVEFNRMLRGSKTAFDSAEVDISFLSTIKYVITIDQDDLLPKGVAQRLAATISHPLNHAKIDKINNITRFGYGLIQPQVSCQKSKNGSLLENTFCGDVGWDSYSGVVSNIYQDVFDTGLFLGRGIYDVDVMNSVLDHRFPENTILSHDHLEGFYGRAGYASDIQIFEDTPVTYDSYTTRLMRWTRGDLQNLPWVFGGVKNEEKKKVINPLPFMARFKLLENALRSLSQPLIFLALLTVFLLKSASNEFILLLSLGFLCYQPLLSLFDFLITRRVTLAWRQYLGSLWNQTKGVLLQIIFRLVFISHLSFITIITVVKTIFRMFISRRHLLEWQIFHHYNIPQSKNKLLGVFDGYYIFELICILFVIVKAFLGGFDLFSGAFVLLGMGIPVWAKIFSHHYTAQKHDVIDRLWYNRLAMKTWRYFDETVSEKTNFLPPDRWQIDKKHTFSNMTSITNIGLYLLSLDVAKRSGYLTGEEYLNRTANVFEALTKMDHHNGHFYNWYNVKTLAVMPPKYISTVDSGNLVASLMSTEHALNKYSETSIVFEEYWATLNGGLSLVLGAMEHDDRKKVHPEIKKNREAMYLLSEDLPKGILGISLFYSELKKVNKILTDNLEYYVKNGNSSNLRYWASKLTAMTDSKISEVELYCPWLENDSKSDNTVFANLNEQTTLAGLQMELINLLSSGENQSLETILNKSLTAIGKTLDFSAELSRKSLSLYDKTDFRFLYNKQRKLFHIGYNCSTKKFDKNHYDLLASESRLTSFVALSLNQVPLKHWQALSRPIAASSGKLVLLSWGGSLFEYLFPQMFLNDVPGSFMTEALRGAIGDHISFSADKRMPWGISESCYDQKNREGDYQYSLHGVPFLSLRPTLKQDLVISPYSSFLALEAFPKQTYDNLKLLEKDGAEGKYGFYESVDYNKPTSLVFGGKSIRAFLSHHQSIILISIYNYLSNGDLRDSFSQHPAVKPLQFLLSEKTNPPTSLRSAQEITREARGYQRITEKVEAKPASIVSRRPLVNLVSNGKYQIYLTEQGGGFCQYDNVNLNPWNADSTLDFGGNQIYIWDEKGKKIIYPRYLAEKNNSTKQLSEFTENEGTFEMVSRTIAVKVTVGLIDDEDLEYRILTIKNLMPDSKKLKIAYASEQILARGYEDIAHPSFNRLKTLVGVNEDHALYSRRQAPGEVNIYAAHKSLTPHSLKDSYLITSRRDFFGRLPGNIPDAIIEPGDFFHQGNSDLVYGNFSLVHLLPFGEFKIVYLAAASFNKTKVTDLLGKYQTMADFEMSLQEDRSNDTFENGLDWEMAQKLLTILLYRRPLIQLDVHSKADNLLGLPELKNRIGANSENPILLASIGSKTSKASFKQLTQYAITLAKKGFAFNFVVLTTDDDGYFKSNLDYVNKLLTESGTKNRPAEIFKNLIIINEGGRTAEEIKSLKSLATIFVDLSAGSLVSQIESEYKKI
ncbi:MAG: glucoamylase family protein [bacterium]